MSTNVKRYGISYQMNIKEVDHLDYIKKMFPDEANKYIEIYGEDNENEDAIWEILSMAKKLRKWCLHIDREGKLGWVYLMVDEESFGDINFSISMREIKRTANELNFIMNEDVNYDRVKAFALDYYNGVESPFKF